MEITCLTLAEWQQHPRDFILLDVRRPDEWEICSLEPALFIPLAELPQQYSQIPKSKKVVIICHHGIRSLKATSFLRAIGYEAYSLRGGIDAWAKTINPSIKIY